MPVNTANTASQNIDSIKTGTGFEGFILSASIRDQGRGGKGTRLVFQGRLQDERRFRWTVNQPRLCFFVEHEAPEVPGVMHRKALPLRTLKGLPVDALYFRSAPELGRARREVETMGLRAYEADVPSPARHLMERGIRGGIRFLDAPVSEDQGLVDFTDGRAESSLFTPRLRLLSIDIETSASEDLYAISLFGDPALTGMQPHSRVFLVDPDRPAGSFHGGYEAHPDERSLMLAFLAAVKECDPDALIGWNVVNFDLRFLARTCARLGIPFALGTDGPAELVEPEGSAYGRLGSNWLARIPGRAVLDGISMLKAAFVPVEGYSLATVSAEILGSKKLIELEGAEKLEEIQRQFREDKEALARYNLQDSVLVHQIFTKLSLSQLAVRKAQLTGLAVDRMGGSIAAFDFLYLPRLHRMGYVADTANRDQDDDGVPGGLVLEGLPGIHTNVLVLDFKSLYPSIIRTFMIDPLAAAAAQHGFAADTVADPTMVRGPAGPPFLRELAILPGIIETLWDARDAAKKSGDKSLSQAVKIIMNSLYGVLGTPSCRFYHPDLAGTITRTGHWILLESKRLLEEKGYRVIYGDTDSLFVHVGAVEGVGGVEALRSAGMGLSAALNASLASMIREKFGVESRLTIEFDKMFLRFFLPALRKEERGSKKRYAGLLVSGAKGKGAAEPGSTEVTLHFAGLESARSDWTRLAKDFQGELLTMVFKQEKVEDREPLERLARDWNRRLFAGDFDDRLVYRKGLSKDPEEYGDSAPPHVRAARALDRPDGRGGRADRAGRGDRIIRYVMTVEGPEPVQKRSAAKPDYRHYADKQLAPIADMVLRFYGTDFHTITQDSRQLSIF